jgi:protein SCO1/2
VKRKNVLAGILLVLMTTQGGWEPEASGADKGRRARQEGLSQDEANRRYFTDTEVVTHQGRTLRFYSDMLKDKVVLISFFYVGCPTAQPTLITQFKLQKALEGLLEERIRLLTISVDPERDSPERLAEFARRYNPGEGWLFVTGKPDQMDPLLRRLGNTHALPEGHQRLFLLGNLLTGHWMKLPESASVIAVADGLRALAAER